MVDIFQAARDDLEMRLIKAPNGVMVGPASPTSYQCSETCLGQHYAEATAVVRAVCGTCGSHWVVTNNLVTMAVPKLEDALDTLMEAIRALAHQGVEDLGVYNLLDIPEEGKPENYQQMIDENCPAELDVVLSGVPYPQLSITLE